MRSKIVMGAIAEKLKKDFKPTKANYEKYASTIRCAIEGDLADVRRKKAALTKKKADAEKNLEELVLSAFGRKLDKTEDAIYNQRKFPLETEVEQSKKELHELDQNALLQTFIYEDFSNFLRNADLYWKRADPDQKHAIARFLFSNIEIGGGKVLALAYKPLIEDLFV